MNKKQILSEKLELHFNKIYFNNPEVSSDTREALFMHKIAKLETIITELKDNKETLDVMLLDVFHALNNCIVSNSYISMLNLMDADYGIMEDVRVYLEDEELI